MEISPLTTEEANRINEIIQTLPEDKKMELFMKRNNPDVAVLIRQIISEN